MKHLARVIIVAALALPSCQSNMIAVDAIADGVTLVSDRHDAMLRGELVPAELDPADVETYLRTSELLRRVIEEAQATGGPR